MSATELSDERIREMFVLIWRQDSTNAVDFARTIIAAHEAQRIAPEAVVLTDEQIDRIAENCAKAMPDGIQGFCKTWGWRQFARELLDVCRGHYRAAPPQQAAQPGATGATP